MEDQEKVKGRFSVEEDRLFMEGLELYGRNWDEIAKHVKTRDADGIKRRARHHFVRLHEKKLPLPKKVLESGEGYTINGEPLDVNKAWVVALTIPTLYNSVLRKKRPRKEEKSSHAGGGVVVGDKEMQFVENEEKNPPKPQQVTLVEEVVVRPKTALQLFFDSLANDETKSLMEKYDMWLALGSDERLALAAQSDQQLKEAKRRKKELSKSGKDVASTSKLPTPSSSSSEDAAKNVFYPALERQRAQFMCPAKHQTGMGRMFTFNQTDLTISSSSDGFESKFKRGRMSAPDEIGHVPFSQSGVWMSCGNDVYRISSHEVSWRLMQVCNPALECRGIVYKNHLNRLVPCFPVGYAVLCKLVLNVSCPVSYWVELSILNGGARPLFRARIVEDLSSKDGSVSGVKFQKQHSNPAKVLMILFDELFDSPFIDDELATDMWAWGKPLIRKDLIQMATELKGLE